MVVSKLCHISGLRIQFSNEYEVTTSGLRIHFSNEYEVTTSGSRIHFSNECGRFKMVSHLRFEDTP